VVFKKILVSHDDKRTSLIYALGHAGLDAFLIAGPTLFLYITCSAAINELGVEGFKSEWADVQTFDLQNVIDTLTGFSVGDVLLMGFDRIVFFIMHIFLSIMVFYAVKREAKVYFWIAVIIRGLCTVPGSLRNFGSYTGGAMETVIMYVYVVVIVAILGFMSVKLYKSYDNTERILMPKDLFTQSRNTLM
jgi:uncharacterized membrane protein YhfC